MANDKLARIIDQAFEGRDKIGPKTKGAVRKAVNSALDLLDTGKARVAERNADGQWQVNQWLKKAVLLSFRLNDMSVIPGGPGKAGWWDKVDSKFKGWNAARFRKAGFRAVPGCVVRHSAFIAPGVVLMPSFVNLGAYVDSGTMIDTWATVGSCAHDGHFQAAPLKRASQCTQRFTPSRLPRAPLAGGCRAVQFGDADTRASVVVAVVEHQTPARHVDDAGILDHLVVPAVGRHIDAGLVIHATPGDPVR